MTDNIMMLPDAGDTPLPGQLSPIDDRGFDHSALTPEAAELVRSTAAEIHRSLHRQLSEVVTSGRALLHVKEVLPHGQFGKWLLSEFGWKERSAQNFMRVESFGENAQRVAHLPLRVVYKLATQAPSIRDAILQRLDKIGGSETNVSAEIQIAINKRAKAKKAERKRARHKAKTTPEQIEAERLELERAKHAAASEAASLIRERMPDQIGTLIDLIDKSGFWVFLDALKARRP